MNFKNVRPVKIWTVFFLFAPTIIAQEIVNQANTKPRIVYFGKGDTHRGAFVGIEFAELAQNRFRDLGFNNYTLLAGQRFWWGKAWKYFGWRFLSINVNLSNEHLSDTVSVIGIEGNRDDLVGHLNVQRLYMDFYPPCISFFEIPAWQRSVLSVTPILSVAPLGYTSHSYTDTLYDDTYTLSAYTPGINVRLNTTILDLFFVETPVIDLHLYLFKNRPVKGQVGGAYIDRPENVGMFGWINMGVKFRF
jgi:hypothetical protein